MSCARYVGYEISVTNMGAALVANVSPKPIMKLERSAGEKQAVSVEPKKKNSPSRNEHANVSGGGLYRDGGDHDGGTDEDGGPPANAIGEVWREGVGGERANVL